MRNFSVRLLLPILLVTFAASCGGKDQEAGAKSKSMIVVFASSDPKIIRGNQEITAQIGTIVMEGDTIKTESGKLDLQTRDGSAIRVSQFTTITVTKLIADNTTIRMQNGQVLASVKRTSKSENFSVVTPTAIAGVRGTTFKVEMYDETQPPRVKVIEGKVAMAPRVAALDNMKKEDVEKSKTLTKLAEVAKSQEVVLEAKTEGQLDPKVNEQVKKANEAIEKAVAAGTPEKVENIAVVQKAAVDLEQKKAVSTAKSEITVQEHQETSTLVAVDRATFDKVVANPTTAAAPQPAAVADLKKAHEEKRQAKQEAVLRQIEDEASKKKLATDAEVRKQYDKLEMVILNSGEQIRGAVIASTNSVLVVHTSKGVRRVNKSDVKSQEFLQ
jgi:hypothetical protein